MTLTDYELTRFILSLLLLLGAAHFFGYLFFKLKLPRVVGEIFGGILLGPTVLGAICPVAQQALFQAFQSQGKLLAAVYWLGLILLMFISGFEIEKSFDRQDGKIFFALVIGSTLIPFWGGWLAPIFFDFSACMGTKSNPLALQIVIAVAFAVTSVPVISRIFIDLGVIQSRFAKIVISAAMTHDAALWIALAVASSLVSTAEVPLRSIFFTIFSTLLFFAGAFFLVPRWIEHAAVSKYNFLIKSSSSGYILFICLLFSVLASILGVNIIFGALLAGIVVGRISAGTFQKEKGHIKEVAMAFFIPLYFSIVGLRLDILRYFDPYLFCLFLGMSTLFQAFGTVLAARVIGLNWLTSFNYSVAMNARGGPGIVLATVAFDLGIIHESFFVILILIAVTTSSAAGWWFWYVLSRRWPLMAHAALAKRAVT